MTAILGFLLLAAPEGWHANLDDGVKAARATGRPVLVVTLWAEKV